MTATDTADADPPLRLAAVDDHPVILRGILWTVEQFAPWITLVAAAPTVSALRAELDGAPVDVVLLNLNLGPRSPYGDADPTRNIHALRTAGAQVLILTAEERPVPVRRAIIAGATGLVLKSDPETQLVAAIRAARSGDLSFSSRLAYALITDATSVAHLAPREKEVLQWLAQGMSRAEIGSLLDPPVSLSTVDTYLKRAAHTYRALGRDSFNAYETMRHAHQDGHITISRPPTPAPT